MAIDVKFRAGFTQLSAALTKGFRALIHSHLILVGITAWWFQICLIFTPTWGNLTIFQMGWFNHQLGISLIQKSQRRANGCWVLPPLVLGGTEYPEIPIIQGQPDEICNRHVCWLQYVSHPPGKLVRIVSPELAARCSSYVSRALTPWWLATEWKHFWVTISLVRACKHTFATMVKRLHCLFGYLNSLRKFQF